MTHTLTALQSGKLLGIKRLKLACGLTEFPKEIFSLADSLEILDLSDNELSVLPKNLSELKNLKVVFFARNKFTQFPSELASCPNLSMVGFRSNNITHIPENVFPKKLQWLILTDNKIEQLPKSIGNCHLLQKCGLAGNQLKELPLEMANCKNLELLRLATNQLNTLPQWLFKLPKLSWIAFNGNSVTPDVVLDSHFESFDWEEFTLKELLGEGASGLISKADWNTQNKEVAIKVFKGEVTTDGLPEDEMRACITAGIHNSLIPVLGKIKNHPENKKGLVMELISSEYTNLGNPPSLETCTRDVFDKTIVFTTAEITNIAKGIASVAEQLHQRGINHGDLYAHNILVNTNAHCLFGDFGAASFYDKNSNSAPCIERVEVRALGCLLDDLLNLVPKKDIEPTFKNTWQQLIDNCMNHEVVNRPNFSEILEELEKI